MASTPIEGAFADTNAVLGVSIRTMGDFKSIHLASLRLAGGTPALQ